MESLPLVVIVGPTASGKTGLSIKIAKAFNGEIISADSRAIYKGMDIGAAKPTEAEREGVSHWGFDLVEPGERFTVADFQKYTNQKIAEIRARGHVPIIAGGTGLYIDSVVFDYEFPAEPAGDGRATWEAQSLQELHEYCVRNNVALPENRLNKRYVVNAILRNGHALKRRNTPIENSIIVGITTDKMTLRDRIATRTEQLFNDGVVGESKVLGKKYGWGSQAMTGNIYPLIRRYIMGELTLHEIKQLFIVKDWHLAKRQLTWFKRNEYIAWLPLDQAYTYVAQTLDNLNKL